MKIQIVLRREHVLCNLANISSRPSQKEHAEKQTNFQKHKASLRSLSSALQVCLLQNLTV